MFDRNMVGVFLAVGLVSAGSEAPAQELTEAEAVARFERESPLRAALAAGIEMARAEARARGLAPNPSVTLTREDAGGSRDDFAILEQAVPITGRRRLERGAGEAAMRAEEAEAAHALARLRGDVRRAFTNLLVAQERESILRDSEARYAELARLLRRREDEGEGSRFDRIRAERDLAEARVEMASGAAALAAARQTLASWFAPGTQGDDLRATGSLGRGTDTPPVPVLVERALAVRGDDRAAGERIERLRSEQRAARRQRVPEPVLAAGLKAVRASDEASDTGFVVSLSVPVPLFDRGQAREAWAAGALRRETESRAALRHRIETEVRSAHAIAESRRRVADEYAVALQLQGDELERIAVVAYREGEHGILELLDAVRAALSMKVRVLELRAAARVAEIDLDLAVGEEVTR